MHHSSQGCHKGKLLNVGSLWNTSKGKGRKRSGGFYVYMVSKWGRGPLSLTLRELFSRITVSEKNKGPKRCQSGQTRLKGRAKKKKKGNGWRNIGTCAPGVSFLMRRNYTYGERREKV